MKKEEEKEEKKNQVDDAGNALDEAGDVEMLKISSESRPPTTNP